MLLGFEIPCMESCHYARERKKERFLVSANTGRAVPFGKKEKKLKIEAPLPIANVGNGKKN